MAVLIEARIFGLWAPFTQNVGVDEAVLAKSTGSPNFSIPLNSVNPLFPSSEPIVLTGSVSGQQVTWSINQTFSQTGGYPIQTTFMNGTQTVVVNVVVNNIATTGTLRSLFSSIAALNIVTLQDASEVRGVHSGGDSTNFINMNAGSASGTINGLPITGLRLQFRNIQHIQHVPLNLKVTGTVTLSDVVPSTSGFNAQVALLPLNSSTPILSANVPVASNGTYEWLPTGIPSGSYRLRVDFGSHLARIVPVTLAGWSPATVNVALANGDADASGEVDAADIDAVIAAFGSAQYGPTIFSDVDQSGEVDAADIDIVIANFGNTDD